MKNKDGGDRGPGGGGGGETRTQRKQRYKDMGERPGRHRQRHSNSTNRQHNIHPLRYIE